MSQPTTAVGEKPARGLLSRCPEWLVVLCLGVGSAAVFTIPFWLHPLFYYVGDNPQSFVPLWRHLGQLLRSGQWPSLEPGGWYGGNIAADSEFSLWNPIGIINDLVVSGYNNMAAAAAFVQIENLALMTMAVYLLCREYGANKVPSVLFGFAMPVCGFAVFYGAAGWPAELTAVTWVLAFWAAAHRMTRGKLTPFVPFVLGVLAITTGNPYAALGMIMVIIALGVEVIVKKNRRALWYLLGMGVCAGATVILVFYPLVEALPVSTRQSLSGIVNNAFLVPHLSDFVASSAPSYLPPIVNWGNAAIEKLPSTYFVWFLIPLLPWLRWRVFGSKLKSLVSLCVFTGIFLVLTVGPSNLWLFRWPIRLIDYFYAGLAVLAAIAFSGGIAKDKLKLRGWLSAGLIAMGAYLAFAVTPEYRSLHLEATLIVAALLAAAIFAHYRRGWRAFGAVLLVGTIAVFSFQTARLPVPESTTIAQPHDVAAIKAGTALYQGTVLQLIDVNNASSSDMANGEILFGNEALLAGDDTLTRYTGIGFDRFTSALCMDYRGDVCPQIWDKLWQPVAGTNVNLIDALRVRTLVIERNLFPAQADAAPPAGWRVAAKDNVRTLWLRTDPLPYPGRVSGMSDGTQVHSADLQNDQQVQHISYTAPEGGGQLMLAQLAWPGYQATVDGQAIKVGENSIGLVTLNVPAGTHTVTLSFHDSGVRIGQYLLALAALAALLLSLFYWRGNRRRDRSGPPPSEKDSSETVQLPALTRR